MPRTNNCPPISTSAGVLRRRSLLAGVAAFGAAPSLSRGQVGSLQSSVPQRVVQVALLAGTAENRLVPLLAQTAARAVAEASAQESANLAARLRDIHQQLNAAQSGAATREVLMSKVSRDLGLATVVDRALVQGRLVATTSGYIEAYEPRRASLAESAAFEMAQALKREPDRANRAYGAVAAALKGSTPSHLPDLASFGVRTDGLAAMLKAARPDVAVAKTFAETLVKETFGKVQGLKALNLKGPGQVSPTVLGIDALKPSLPVQVEGFQAGAAALHGVLNLIGDSGAAQEVKKAAMYAESAVQVYQAVSLIASAASGWGMVTAAAGLLSGGGGLAAFSGVFGGGSDGGQAERAAEARHAETMAAIKGVHTLVEREFAKLNTKVDFIIKQLGDMLQLMDKIGRDTELLVALVRETNRKVDDLTFRVSLNEIARTRLVNKERLSRCASRVLNNQALGGVLTDCRGLYGGTAGQLAGYPWMLNFDGADKAGEILHRALSFNPDDGRYPELAWAAARALRSRLIGYGITALDQPAFEPTLVLTLDGYASLRERRNRPEFDKANVLEVREQVDTIRIVASRHRAFVAALQGTTNVKSHRVAGKELQLGDGYRMLMGRLFELYEVHLANFESGVKSLAKTAVTEFVVKYRDGPLAQPFDVALTSQSEQGVSMPFLSAADFGAGKLTGLLQCPTCDPAAGNQVLELVIVSMTLAKPFNQLRSEGLEAARKHALEAAKSTAMERTGAAKGAPLRVPETTTFWIPGHQVTIEVRLYGKRLHQFSHDFSVVESTATDVAARSAALGTTQVVTSPIAYLRAQNGKSPWPFEGFVVKRALPTLERALVDQAVLAELARDRHVEQILATNPSKTQELLRAAMKETGFLGGTRPSAVEAPLTEMEALGDVMRGVCQLGHEEATAASDVLQRLFDGGLSQRLVDRQLVKDWATAPGATGQPKELVGLDKAARERFEQLKIALAFVMDSTLRRGPSYSFERAWRRFSEAFPLDAYPPCPC